MSNSLILAEGIRKSLAEGLKDVGRYFLWEKSSGRRIVTGGCVCALATHGVSGKPLETISEEIRAFTGDNAYINAYINYFSKITGVSVCLLENIETLHCIFNLTSEAIAEMLENGEISENEFSSYDECNRLAKGKKIRTS